MLKKRALGKTNIEVTPIGIGVMMWLGGEKGIWKRMSKTNEADQKIMIREAIDGGINFFDTAELYGWGRSESALAKALKANNVKDTDVVIGTKWNPLFRNAINMRRSIKKRLSYLSDYSIDLYMIHFPLSYSTIKAQMRELAKLVQEQKIRSVGVSNFNAKQMRKAHNFLEKYEIPLAVNQVNYSLIRREIETNGILETAKELGVTIVAYSPLAHGLLTGKHHIDSGSLENKTGFMRRSVEKRLVNSKPLIDLLRTIGEKYNSTPGQVALNWLVNYSGDTVVAIPGASKVSHAKESAGTLTFTLTQTEMDEIANCEYSS